MTKPTLIAASEAKSARDLEREKQVRQAEELLFIGETGTSVVKELFHGRFAADLVFPYPRFSAAEQPKVDALLSQLRAFCDKHLDANQIDRQANIPRHVIDGLSRLGILGLTAPENVGGQGLSQLAYCRALEEIGSRCGSTAIFVNAHHSIGMHALLLFGTESQKKQWLPDMVAGRKLAAFALTETQAGSDAGNVQTTAMPTGDGSQFILNGDKRYITNGAIADVLTVMARTPVAGRNESAVTAFLVTPDMPGFRVVEPRMEKLGVRGTATAKLAFKDMHVSRENVLGPLGKGLKVALTVLDFGRIAFGATCTGAAKTCLRLALEHARTRVQFGRPLGEFPLVQDKLARIAASAYAMEAMTTFTAGLIDRRMEDYMLETAMLKVYASEALWTIVNDAFQINGGSAYFTDKPLERMLRDARINQIGEGANEVMTSFIALVGMRGPGERLKAVWETLARPLANGWPGARLLGRFTAEEVKRRIVRPRVELRSPGFSTECRRFSRLVRRFGLDVEWALISNREEILERQLVQEPIAVAGMELYASACVLSRIDEALSGGRPEENEIEIARLFLSQSARRCRLALNRLADHDNSAIERTAESLLHSE